MENKKRYTIPLLICFCSIYSINCNRYTVKHLEVKLRTIEKKEIKVVIYDYIGIEDGQRTWEEEPRGAFCEELSKNSSSEASELQECAILKKTVGPYSEKTVRDLDTLDWIVFEVNSSERKGLQVDFAGYLVTESQFFVETKTGYKFGILVKGLDYIKSENDTDESHVTGHVCEPKPNGPPTSC